MLLFIIKISYIQEKHFNIYCFKKKIKLAIVSHPVLKFILEKYFLKFGLFMLNQSV